MRLSRSIQLALTAVRGPQLGCWLSELGSPNIQEEHLVFDLVKEFLQNAGQSQMIVQCEQSENELTQLACQQSILIRTCLDLLSQYSAICNLYPLSSMAQHRSVAYHAWASKLLMTGTVEACHEVLAQMEAAFGQAIAGNAKVQRTLAFSYQVSGRERFAEDLDVGVCLTRGFSLRLGLQIQVILGEANEKFSKAYERMINEGLPDSLVRIEKAYVESKSQITAFLRREKGAEKALECVYISALCDLNKK